VSPPLINKHFEKQVSTKDGQWIASVCKKLSTKTFYNSWGECLEKIVAGNEMLLQKKRQGFVYIV
jgi:hypothetical protein